jgi:hypothetical protein
MGGQQQVMSIQLGWMTLPSLFTTTAPGPPTYAMHSDKKL